MTQLYQGELAQLYDVAVPDWPGEIQFYRNLIRQIAPDQESVLEIACGTGRVTVQLADSGAAILGMDLSEEMLAFAKSKGDRLSDVRWIFDDMRSFELGQTFGLIIVPAYSFQLLLAEADQTACLAQIAKHLHPNARLVLHLEQHDPEWLASLPIGKSAPFEVSGEAIHPGTRKRIRVSYAWSYVPARHSVAVIIRYETLDESGKIISCTDRGPMQMHCTSPPHLRQQLVAVGLETDAVYGDFLGQPYDSSSEELVWVARKA